MRPLVALLLVLAPAAGAGGAEIIYELHLARGASADAFTFEIPHEMRVTYVYADCRGGTGALRVVGPGGEFGATCGFDESIVDSWGVAPAGTYAGTYAFQATGSIHFLFLGERA